jgi:NOL1/NOP2/fmu family ribosome biogenesis protein
MDIDKQEALRYLRRESIQIPGASMGFTLLTFDGLPIGWVNVLSNRLNNMYPSDWRIRMSG